MKIYIERMGKFFRIPTLIRFCIVINNPVSSDLACFLHLKVIYAGAYKRQITVFIFHTRLRLIMSHLLESVTKFRVIF